MTSWRPPSQAKAKPTRSRKSSAGSVRSGLQSPILGRKFKVPDLYADLPPVELDDTLPYVPVYCHFLVPDIEPIVRPKTPPILTALRAEFGDLYLMKSKRTKPEQRSKSTHHSNHRHTTKNY